MTHEDPHRRLWMGPQFSFKTYLHANATATPVLSSSSAVFSPSEQQRQSAPGDVFTEEMDLQSLKLVFN